MRILILLVALLVGCQFQSTPGEPLSSNGTVPVSYFHDQAHGVSCWLYGGSGNYGKAISCLPDSQVKP